MRRFLDRLRRLDPLLTFAVFALVVFGLASIYSVALATPNTGLTNVWKQLISAGLGLGLFLTAASWDYRQLRHYALAAYTFGLALLVGVLFFGKNIRGTTGWFDFGAFSFQPVEFMKLALVLMLAWYFSRRGREAAGWKELWQSFLIVLVPVAFTLKQPDLGSSLLLLATWGAMILFAGLERRYVLSLFFSFIVLCLSAWPLLRDYQRERILTFLDPSRDPRGEGYHVIQALIAVGAGGLFGRGLGFGTQSQLKFLPESQTDFVFAVIAEELGFLGVVLVIGAFVLLLSRLFYFASRTRDAFTAFFLIGAGGLLFAQFTVNVGMNLGLLPVTGITLPLVSYGGSSLLLTLLLLGLAASVSVHDDPSPS